VERCEVIKLLQPPPCLIDKANPSFRLRCCNSGTRLEKERRVAEDVLQTQRRGNEDGIWVIAAIHAAAHILGAVGINNLRGVSTG